VVLGKAAFGRVSGRVEGLADLTKATVRLERLSVSDSSLTIPTTDSLSRIIGAPIQPDGTFSFAQVALGTYRARLFRAPNTLRGSTIFNVRGSDVENVRISAPTTFTLKGKVTFEKGEHPGRLQLLLWETEDAGSKRLTPVDVAESGEFEVKEIALGVHRFSFARKDQFVVVKVQAGSHTTEGGAFELNSSEPIAVTLSTAASTINGSLEGYARATEKQAASPGFVTVIATPSTILESETLQVAAIDVDGRFSVKQLEPGKYRVCGWRDDRARAAGMQTMALWQQRLDSACSSIHVEPGKTESITVKGLSVTAFN